MRMLLSLLALASGCQQLDCAPGTIESNGHCEPADVTTNAATCGSGTKLEGTVCVSTTTCDPATTMPMTDSNGNTICVGVGGGCGTCPATPASGKQNICGQIYDLENMTPFAATGATGARCPMTSTATSGPCALAIKAFDAVMYATDPSTATPLAVDDTCIDDMGRYYLKNIVPPGGTSPFIGLGIDDANSANAGPPGVTNAVGVATAKLPDTATTGFEAYVVSQTVTNGWASSGGPTVAGGIFAMMFRAHCAATSCTGDRLASQAGVQMTKNGTPIVAANAKYFVAAQTTRDTIDPTAIMTGANGTGLNNNASVADGPAFSATGGITDTTNCTWATHAGAALANIVFVQVFRKVNAPGIGHTCTE